MNSHIVKNLKIGRSFEGKKVLVTGHTGFKGSWLTLWLNELGAEVAGFSNNILTNPSLFEQLELSKSIQDFRGDIRDFDVVSKVFKDFSPEIVFHLAAQSQVYFGFKDPLETISVNVLGTTHILELLKKTASCRVGVVVTTDKCYENFNKRPRLENDRLGGDDPYSASKACAELLFKAYELNFFKSENKKVATARAGNVIGSGDFGSHRLVPDCIRAWGQNQEVELRLPNAVRPWQFVVDVIAGYLVLGEALLNEDNNENESGKRVSGEAFNFGPGEGEAISVQTLVKGLASEWDAGAETGNRTGVGAGAGPELRAKYASRKSEKTFSEKSHLLIDSSKAEKFLGWKHTTSFEKMTAQAVAGYKAMNGQSADLKRILLSQIVDYNSAM